jgi:hypothetical protein
MIGLDFYESLVPPDQENRMIRPPKWGQLVLFVVSFSVLTVGVGTILNDNSLGWLLLVTGAIITLVSICLLLPGCSFLELTQEGFTLCRLFRRETFRWNDVTRFGVVLVGQRPKVVFQNADPTSKVPPHRVFKNRPSGFEAALPGTFGLGPEVLAVLMNDWRVRSLSAAQQPLPASVRLARIQESGFPGHAA